MIVTYCTRQDLVDRFGETELIQLTDRARPPTMIDDAVLGRAIGDAAALVDGYLARVVALPLLSSPPVLVKIAADLARYFLHGKAADKDSPVTRAYGEAVAWLRDVSRGLIALEAGGVAPPPAPESGGRAEGSDPVFTRDTLRGF